MAATDKTTHIAIVDRVVLGSKQFGPNILTDIQPYRLVRRGLDFVVFTEASNRLSFRGLRRHEVSINTSI